MIYRLTIVQAVPLSWAFYCRKQRKTTHSTVWNICNCKAGWKQTVTFRNFVIWHEFYEQDGIIFEGKMGNDNSNNNNAENTWFWSGNWTMFIRAKEAVYWPGKNDQLKCCMEKCDICRSWEDCQPNTFATWDVWKTMSRVGMDLFCWANEEYVITVMLTTGTSLILIVPDTSVTSLIHKIKMHFQHYGIPENVYSNNRSQFKAGELFRVSRNWDLDYIALSQGYPQSKVETAIKNSKEILAKRKNCRRRFIFGIVRSSKYSISRLKVKSSSKTDKSENF